MARILLVLLGPFLLVTLFTGRLSADTCFGEVVKRTGTSYALTCFGNCTGGGSCTPRHKAGSTNYFCGCQSAQEPACCSIGVSGGSGSGNTVYGSGVITFGFCAPVCGTSGSCVVRPAPVPSHPIGTQYIAACE